MRNQHLLDRARNVLGGIAGYPAELLGDLIEDYELACVMEKVPVRYLAEEGSRRREQALARTNEWAMRRATLERRMTKFCARYT